MADAEIERYILDTFANVETGENYGYKFFFYGSDHMLPFATMIAADNDYDRISNLNRPGVYRLNIGVSRQTFQSLFGPERADVSRYDYTALDRFMPHPDYAPQNWICVLSPGQETLDRTQTYLAEAYEIAQARNARRAKTE